MFASIHTAYSTPPELRIRNNSEHFNRDNVTVVLEWTQEMVFASYALTIIPMGPEISMLVRNTSAHVTLPYNYHFNISIARSICNQTFKFTIINLTYSKIHL